MMNTFYISLQKISSNYILFNEISVVRNVFRFRKCVPNFCYFLKLSIDFNSSIETHDLIVDDLSQTEYVRVLDEIVNELISSETFNRDDQS